MRLVQSNTASCHQPLERIAQRLHQFDRECDVDTFGRLCENDFVGADQDLVAGRDAR